MFFEDTKLLREGTIPTLLENLSNQSKLGWRIYS